MGYFTLAVAALCALQAVVRVALLRRREGDVIFVVQSAGLVIVMLSVSLNLPPLRDSLPAHPRVDVALALAIVGAVVVISAPFVALVPLAVRTFRAHRTVRD